MDRLRAAALLCLVVFGLPVYAQTVKVNWRTGAPFGSYKTYAWQDSKNPGLPFYGRWVKSDVLAELASKGLTAVAAGQTPDVIVTYHIQGQELIDTTFNTDGDGFGWGGGPWGGGWGWFGGWGGWGPFDEDSTTFTSDHPHDILMLTISMADAKTKALVWRGQATVDNPSKFSKRRRKANQTVRAKALQKLSAQKQVANGAFPGPANPRRLSMRGFKSLDYAETFVHTQADNEMTESQLVHGELLNWAKSRGGFFAFDTLPGWVIPSSFSFIDRRILSRKTLLACVGGSNLIVRRIPFSDVGHGENGRAKTEDQAEEKDK